MLTNPLKILKEYPRQLRLMFYGMLISSIGSSMIWPFLMIYLRQRVDMPLTHTASLMTINATAGLMAAFIAGPITNPIGCKWILVVSLAGNGAVYFWIRDWFYWKPGFLILFQKGGKSTVCHYYRIKTINGVKLLN